MAGQLIVLPGVTAAASANAPRISMNGADSVAAKIATLKHAISARSLTNLPGGGVSGRCRVTGLPLIPKGSTPANLSVTEVAGKKALAAGSASGLALPAGSLTSSYTMVLALAVSSADAASSTPFNALSGFDGSDTYTAVLLRNYGAASSAPNTNNLMTAGPVSTTDNVARTSRPSGAWAIVVLDFDRSSGVASIAVNQTSSFTTAQRSTWPAISSGSYTEIGYHLTSGLGSSKAGDLYTFEESLLASDLGRSQLAELVSALKTAYSIA